MNTDSNYTHVNHINMSNVKNMYSNIDIDINSNIDIDINIKGDSLRPFNCANHLGTFGSLKRSQI